MAASGDVGNDMANAAAPSRAGQEQAREIRHRGGELQRKDQALAEAAALLLLQQKVQARWGEGEAANSTSRSASK